MAEYTFYKDDGGIQRLLKGKQCLSVMEKNASNRYGDAYKRPFIGFDRAKVFVEQKRNDRGNT